jgi:hypothetical protein
VILEMARRRGAGRLSNFFTNYLFDPRVEIPSSSGELNSLQGNRNRSQGKRTSWVFPFRVSTSVEGPASLTPYPPRARSGSGTLLSPGTWFRGNRRPRWQDVEREQERGQRQETESRKKQQVTVEYSQPGSAPILKLRKLSTLSLSELDRITLKMLSPVSEVTEEKIIRSKSLPPVRRKGAGLEISKPAPIPISNFDGMHEYFASKESLEVLKQLLPEFPRTPERAQFQLGFYRKGSSESDRERDGVRRTLSGKRKPVPRFSQGTIEQGDGNSRGSKHSHSDVSDRNTPPSSFQEPSPSQRKSIRDSLTLSLGHRVHRLSSPFTNRSRSNSRAQEHDSFRSHAETDLRIQIPIDPDPFRKASPPPPVPPVPPVPSIHPSLYARLSEPPPLSPGILSKSSPLTATVFSASRTVSLSGSMATDSVVISSPFPLQPTSRRQELARPPTSPTQARNRLTALNLSLTPSLLFPSNRLSTTSTASGSRFSSYLV